MSILYTKSRSIPCYIFHLDSHSDPEKFTQQKRIQIPNQPYNCFTNIQITRPAYRSVWSIRYVHRYILIDNRYIIWYFTCDYVTKTSLCFPCILIKKVTIQWYETRIEHMVVRIASVKSPYKFLILVIFIDSSYNQTALVSFVIANVHNWDPSWWMCKRRYGGEMQKFSVPAGNWLEYVSSENPEVTYMYFACVYSIHWFELVHTVSMGYLCVANQAIVTVQPRNISPRSPFQNWLWLGHIMIMTLAMVETELRR